MHTTPSSSLQPVDATGRIPASGARALVLGGGGSTGNAWLIGVVAGLFDGGLDVTAADLIVGTSAGATAAAQITLAPLPELLNAAVTAMPPARQAGSVAGRSGMPPVATHLEKTAGIIASAANHAEMRRAMGAAALDVDAASDGSWTAQWRTTVAARLPRTDWPEVPLSLTAVDARSGEGVAFTRDSGVELVDAVAASTSGGPHPYRIGDDRYIDGGYRTNAENADLAAGYDHVLVLSPFGGRTRMPLEWGMHLAPQVAELRAQGSGVETVFPKAYVEHLFGVNGMDVSLRPEAARSGFEQGRGLADRLRGFWVS
jgi:NTE family protein